MNSKTLTEIDYYRIRNQIADLCISEEGKNELLLREPLTDLTQIDFFKNCSREWIDFLSVSHSLPFGAWEPVQPLFAVIHTRGAALELEQVRSLGNFIQAVNSVKDTIAHHSEKLNFKVLVSESEKIPDLSDAERKIFRIITKDGEMKDLPEIIAIRRQISSLNARLKNIFSSYISEMPGVLENSVPVLRGGRQVLAVKASQQNRIKGIIHEVSVSGQTVYIEPEDAVICTNELIQKEFELQSVIKRILTELTFDLQPSIPAFKAALPVMLCFDGTFAAARYATQNNGIFAQNCKSDEPPFLLQARHPLLAQKAVPIDVRFMSEKRVLIITGPNTGGKTVTLKTFALFSMLNQAGFPVLAAEGTRLPVFTDIFADIGDEQSLDQSLSTFSGHMKNIADALKNADENSLILLDELGSGTDPQEGTAISMAVLDFLIQKKSFVLVTTHQGILKNYGYTNPSCINASVEFNSDTLSPSYRLIMGVPGESHALDIASRSGIPENILVEARKYIATEQADVSSLIKGLNKKHSELDKLQRKLDSQNEIIESKQEKIVQRELELRRRENQLKKGKMQEINDFLIHSRRQLENLVRQLKEGEVTREKTLGVKQFISELEKNTTHLEEKLEKDEEKLERAEADFAQKQKHPASNKKTKKKMSNSEALKFAVSHFESPENPAINGKVSADGGKSKKNQAPAVFCEGSVVESISSKTRGILISPAKKGVWQVQFGSVKMNVKEKDLKLISSPSEKPSDLPFNFIRDDSVQNSAANYDGSFIEKTSERPVFELRLLGMRGDEAIKALEHQIDLCILNNLLTFSVIHGTGEGILKQLVTDYLSNCPHVKEFSFASAEDGGFGKTYVTLI